MPLSRKNTGRRTTLLYAGQLEKVRLHKRDDDQRQGTVTTHVLFRCRRSRIQKSGQTLDGDLNVGHKTQWHIPRDELDRVGVAYLNPLDKIEQLKGTEAGNVWSPESDTGIDVKLFGNMVVLDCKLRKPKVSNVGRPGY